VNPRIALRLAFVGLFVSVFAATAQKPAPQHQQPSKSKTAASSTATDESAEGEKRFETNCGRCHVPPEDLSPREAKAVLRQMRVRADLTAEDERLILKYLAP
jgi:cytochrome c5